MKPELRVLHACGLEEHFVGKLLHGFTDGFLQQRMKVLVDRRVVEPLLVRRSLESSACVQPAGHLQHVLDVNGLLLNFRRLRPACAQKVRNGLFDLQLPLFLSDPDQEGSDAFAA